MFVNRSYNSVHFPLPVLPLWTLHCILGLEARNSSIWHSSAAIVIFMTLYFKIRELSLAYCHAFPSSIIAVDVLGHQSLYNRFQTPIFFSTIAIVFLDHSDHYSQSAIDNLNHSDRHFQSPIDNLNHSDRRFQSPIDKLNHSDRFLDLQSWTHTTFDRYGLP